MNYSQGLEMRFGRKFTMFVMLGLMLGYSASLSAKTYKWVDANGGVHYSQVPPEKSRAKTIEVKDGGSEIAPKPETEADTSQAKPDASDTTPASYNVMVPEKADSEAMRAAEAERRKQQQEACDALRNNLKILQQNTRIRIRDNEGQAPRVLTPEERQQRIKQYSENLNKMCQ